MWDLKIQIITVALTVHNSNDPTPSVPKLLQQSSGLKSNSILMLIVKKVSPFNDAQWHEN